MYNGSGRCSHTVALWAHGAELDFLFSVAFCGCKSASVLKGAQPPIPIFRGATKIDTTKLTTNII